MRRRVHAFRNSIEVMKALVSSSSRLSNDILQFIDLPLGSAEGTKLQKTSLVTQTLLPITNSCGKGQAYSSLSQLSSSLVTRVSEQFDDSAFVGC